MGINGIPLLKDNLAFKGGTALKKCYFGEYRFSEDLDFSYIGNTKNALSLTRSLQEACDIAAHGMSAYMPSPILIMEQYTEKQPHPEGQLAFIIRAQLPWHKEPTVKIMVEITMQEKVILPLIPKNIIHKYGEDINATVNVYSLEEIISEKLRAILQYTKKLHEQGWARSRVRDYYDLWNIFKNFSTQINTSVICNTLQNKCEPKGVTFKSSEDFFNPITLEDAKKSWEQWLAPLVNGLPSYDRVIGDLKYQVNMVLMGISSGKE
jgi:predicted nucleotidyltransferase component of viral defense system